ncbi:MAG: LacI family transcriptional regulator [Conexibacteraceae bacterium]|nr:LacI family transcriptional regulator [Conexibacteraceae bacterium]
MRATATIRDVARVAEVHPGTVSRALNPETRALVNDETAARVLAAADELGYRPNPIARGLKTQRSYTVGVLIPDLLNPLFPPIVRGVDDRLAKDGYTPLLVNTDRDLEREQASVETMLARQVDGFIAATARLDMEPLVAASAEGVPVVLVNRSVEDGSLASVTVDDRTGIRLAVEHVIALGHERVAHVAGPQNVSTGRLRLMGFRAAMEAHALGAPAERVAIGESFGVEAGAEACAEVLAADAGVTAIIAANDLLALGCYAALTELGLRCPEDVSIVGFNDMLFVDKLQPPLTTVRVPQRELGFVAADLLLEQIGGVATGPREVVLDPSLVIRDSTAPARA